MRAVLGRAVRFARAHALEWSGRNGRARERLDGSRACVLMYHRVLPRAEVARTAVEPGMYVSRETFARHLEWLQENFRVLPLHEIVRRLLEGLSLPEGACAITFDDGWRDNLEHALPELEGRGLPATLFVVSDRVGSHGGFWPDEVWRRMASLTPEERVRIAGRLGVPGKRHPVDALLDHLKGIPEAERPEALATLRSATLDPRPDARELLDWQELHRLSGAGVDVESHGATHAILTGLPDRDVEWELRSARERLREAGHARHDLLAYPSGAHDDRVIRMAHEVGYRAAFTTLRGLIDAETEFMALPRVGIHDGISRTRAEFLSQVPESA